MRIRKDMKESRRNGLERIVEYDISSCSETERRNEMTLKAAFIYKIIV